MCAVLCINGLIMLKQQGVHSSWRLGVLAGHPKDEGDQEGGQYRVNGCSPTRHGQQAKQGRQEDIPLVLNLRFQPLTELEEEGNDVSTAPTGPAVS